MDKFYTYVQQYGSKLLVRGFENGKSFIAKTDFKPSLFVKSKKGSDSKWKALNGDPLDKITFGDIKDAREFIERYKDVQGFPVHGMTQFAYQYINEHYPGQIEWSLNNMKVSFLDIECVGEEGDGFPDISQANIPIVLVSLHYKSSNKTVVYGVRSYKGNGVAKFGDGSSHNFEYRVFKDEQTMLKAFIQDWKVDYPDIVSGWNTDQFDFPYLINRIVRILDDDWCKQLSPFGIIKEKNVEIRGKEVQTYDIYGVVQLDYFDLYKKYTYNQRESYGLGAIASEEIGESKTENPGSSFYDFYTNYFDTFVAYNAKDSILVHKIDDKLKLIELAIEIAFLAKCNIRDTFGPVKTWDVFIYNFLAKDKIAIPPQSKKLAGEFEGAYVKDVKPGMYGWTVSFDFTSLYPTIIRQWNMSPETLVDEIMPMSVRELVNGSPDDERFEYARKNNYTIAANGTMYRKDKEGLLPKLMAVMLSGRKVAKNEMLKLEQEYQNTHNSVLVPKISALNNKQMAFKILANSAYGAISNVGFRYFDLKIAEAITLSGQASDMHLEKTLNSYINKAMNTTNVEYVIYADTDSVYVHLQPVVDKLFPNKSIDETTKFLDDFCEDVLQKVVNKSVTNIFNLTNGYTKLMSAKREAIASKALWTTKKRYAMMVHNSEGVEYKPYKLKIMGLDIIKTSTPHYVRAKLKHALIVMFERSEKELREYVDECYNDFMKTEVENIAFPRSVSDIDKWLDTTKLYKFGTPIHVRGSILFNTYVKGLPEYRTIQNGDKIKFLYLKLPNIIKENVIAFPTDEKMPPDLVKWVDKELQWEKSFVNPLETITLAINWKLKEESSLESFFG